MKKNRNMHVQKRLFAILFLACSSFFVACNETEEDEAETTVPTPAQQATPSQTNKADQACTVCALEIDIIKLENTIGLLHRDPKRKAQKDKVRKEYDSLNAEYNKLIVPYNGDINRAKQECSANYPVNAVTDTAQRNALMAEYFVWYHNSTFPEFDTTAYIPVIRDGKYEVNHKGVVQMLTKAQHDAYLKSGLETMNATKKIYDSEIKRLAGEITKLPNEKIDEVCIAVLGYLSLMYQEHPVVSKIRKEGKEYLKYMKLQTDMWN